MVNGVRRELVSDLANYLKAPVGTGPGMINLWVAQELLLLHELGHAAGAPAIVADGGAWDLSLTNTKKVWTWCFEP
ncbi:MAG: hypothetical protein Kow00109_29380 [Acidobacteriota bacterium]